MDREYRRGLFAGLTVNVVLLAVVSFLTDISSETMLAVLPLYITALGGTGLAVGLIGGIGDSVASLLKVFSGYWSDRLGRRKPLVIAGYILSAFGKLLFPVARSWTALLVLRPVERVGKGIRSAPRDALLASSCTPETRGKGFGLHRAADSAGAVVGSALALLLVWAVHLGLRSVLLIAGLAAFLAVIPLLFVREEPCPPRVFSLRLGWRSLGPGFRRYLVAATLFALANFTYMIFILRARDAFAPRVSGTLAVALPILLYVWFNVVYALFALPMGMLSDRIGRRRVLLAGYAVFAVSCLLFGILRSFAGYVLAFAVYGLAYAIVEGNQRAFAADFVTPELRGTALGTFHTAISIAELPAGIIAGLLFTRAPALPFLYGGVLALVACAVLFGVRREA